MTALALIRPELTPVWSARLCALHAIALNSTGREDEALAAAKRAEDEGTQVGDPVAMGYALNTQVVIMGIRRSDEAAKLAILDRALAVLGDEPRAADLRLLLLGNRATALGNLGREADGDHVLAQAVMLAERAGNLPRLWNLRVTTATQFFYQGRWDEVHAEFQASGDLPVDVEARLTLRGLAAMVAVHRDDRAILADLLRGVDELTSADGIFRKTRLYLMIAWASSAERDGRANLALIRLLAVLDPTGTQQFASYNTDSPLWLPDLVRLALTIGDRDVAAAAAQACTADAEHAHRPDTAAAALHCQGLIDADPARLAAAADRLHRRHRPLLAAHALENAAVLYAEQGHLEAARAAYQQAIATYTDLDATWDLMRTDTRLRPHNIRRAPAPLAAGLRPAGPRSPQPK